ncbi:MAG: ABC transporter permease, partial [Acidobacteriota bacterium]|nr:ABC transporter permease [Acidobacteriota bacterium]
MILAVARTHFAKLKRDRAALVLSFVLPVVFFSLFATIFGGGSSRATTRQIRVVVVDEDKTANSARFIAALKREKGVRVVETTTLPGGEKTPIADAAAAEAIVRAGEVPVALIVPKGFGASPVQFGAPGSGPRLKLLADTSDPIAPQVLSGLLQKVAMTAMPDVMAQSGIEQVDRWGGDLTPEQKARLQKNVDALRQQGTGSQGTGGELVVVDVRDVLGEKMKNPAVAVLAAGLGVMFLLFSAAGAGGALIEEVESGTLDRVLSTRVTMTRLLLGKMVYLASVAVAQLTVMFVWGEIFFGVELHRHVTGFLVMAVVTALAASAFGLVLAALSRTRMQLVALSNMVILVMSALGGSMFPRFLMSEGIQKIGLITLNAWAIDGFMKVFWRDAPLLALWPQVLFLAAAAVLLFGIARRLA